MPKEIRFSKLIQTAGKPEVVTLWEKPKSSSAFMEAVNENRVVTVVQNPTGNKKDFGTTGFHQEKFATYLVFPKRIPKLDDVHIIGIKYELLQEQVSTLPPRRKSASTKATSDNSSRRHSKPAHNGAHKPKSDGQKNASTPVPANPEPIKKFQVTIRRTGTAETILTVKAKTISEAEADALGTVKVQKFEPEEIQAVVISISKA